MKQLVTLLCTCLIFCCFVEEICTQITPTSDDVRCYDFDTACSLCIQDPHCQWCSQSKHNFTEHHCFHVSTDLSNICNEIENPQNSQLDIIENKPLTDSRMKNIDYKDIVQMRPQRVGLKLRKGVAVNITVSYRQVKDYPLDLYYLMDLSKSMEEDKKTLAKLGRELARTMRNLTGQFKIGFGSFVDKVMLPYVNIHPNSLSNPCKNCDPPFSFKNNLKLSEDDKEFVRQVEAARISSNLDSPEGGFDALMQTMVCEEKIGWRKNVRKIIIFSTDALPHSAGDGKLAGIVRPNDGKCHLNSDGYYTKYDEYDYPSIGQLEWTAKKKGINMIFAVKGHQEFYEKLSERIKDSSFGELDVNSGNIIDLVTNVYNSITGKVKIDVKSDARNSPAIVRFFSDCGLDKSLKETPVCNNVAEGASFNFTIELMVTDCSKSKEYSTTQIEIGTLQESLLVDLELLCDCGCESERHVGYEELSASCSGNGTKQCEVCLCNEGFYGQHCQCSKSNVASRNNNDQSKCRPGGSNSSESVCSGRGRCECETCICWQERHYGRFCECDKGMCTQNLDPNTECSGNGRCDCNRCLCNPGYEGQFCECQSSQACYPKDEEKPCSGNGECHCGKCECHETYTGKYCEECPVCEASKCSEFRPCVQCDVWRSGELKGDPCKNCTYRNIPRVDDLEQYTRKNQKSCRHEDEETGCYFFFTYKYLYEEDKYEIYAEHEQKCPEQINTLAVTFGVIAGIVLIGVLTLIIWKISTTIHDRREFMRFEKESQNAAWNTADNPIYKSATTTVANPGFSSM